jgi:cell wall-associated NlpC family hydrolase
MPSRQEWVAQLRTWLDTPYQHRARQKGVGVDCIGLLTGAGKELGITELDWDSYAALPNGNHMLREAEASMRRIRPRLPDGLLPGDVLLMAWRGRVAQHLAVVTCLPDGRRGMIHANSITGAVKEHTLSQDWIDLTLRVYLPHGITE